MMLPTFTMEPRGAPQATSARATACVTRKVPCGGEAEGEGRPLQAPVGGGGAPPPHTHTPRDRYLEVHAEHRVERLLRLLEQKRVARDPSAVDADGGRPGEARLRRGEAASGRLPHRSRNPGLAWPARDLEALGPGAGRRLGSR